MQSGIKRTSGGIGEMNASKRDIINNPTGVRKNS